MPGIVSCARIMLITLASILRAKAAMAQLPQGFDGLRPIIETHTMPPYPDDAVRLGEKGTTLMQVHITTYGTVDDCKVIQSSSSDRLDAAACDHIKSVWRWQPPTARGRPIAINTRVSVKWDIPKKPPPFDPLRPIIETQDMPRYAPLAVALNKESTTVMEVRITDKGTVEDCKVVQSSGSDRLDETLCEHVKEKWRWEPPTAGGQPTRVTTRVVVNWDLKVKDPLPLMDGVKLRPIMATHTMPPYPRASYRLGEQGLTLMTVDIDIQGVVSSCAIVRSSGSGRLDAAACDHVKRVWRWEPPKAAGQPTSATTRVYVKWDVRDASP